MDPVTSSVWCRRHDSISEKLSDDRFQAVNASPSLDKMSGQITRKDFRPIPLMGKDWFPILVSTKVNQ